MGRLNKHPNTDDIHLYQNAIFQEYKVHLLLVACSVFIFVIFSSTVPQARGLFLGLGGVYDSPEAQEYWNRRFGADTFAAIRAAGKASRSQAKAIAPPAVSPREAKVQELATNEILPQVVSPNRYIPTFR